jgi:hypothetical protein
MPVSPEQRQILLERLEKARKAKADKSAVLPNGSIKKQGVSVAERPTVPVVEPAQLAPVVPVSSPSPLPKPPVEVREPEGLKANSKQKNKYMKVVFYSEPPKRKVENLLKSLDDNSEESSPPQTPKPRPKNTRNKVAPPRKQKGGSDSASLDELALLYFS